MRKSRKPIETQDDDDALQPSCWAETDVLDFVLDDLATIAGTMATVAKHLKAAGCVKGDGKPWGPAALQRLKDSNPDYKSTFHRSCEAKRSAPAEAVTIADIMGEEYGLERREIRRDEIYRLMDEDAARRAEDDARRAAALAAKPPGVKLLQPPRRVRQVPPAKN